MSDAPVLQSGTQGMLLSIDGIGSWLAFAVTSSDGKSLQATFNLDATAAASFHRFLEQMQQRRAA